MASSSTAVRCLSSRPMDDEVGTTQWILAAVFIAGALLVAFILDRILAHRGRALAQAVARGEISPETDTRLRFVRRLAYAGIVLFGVALALSQFSGIKDLAASLLASGAIAAAILGFAARQTLANFVAGIMIAVTQPLRVGDWVLIEDEYGAVEDIRLNYTFLRTAAGRQVVVPNEKLASGILRNDSLGDGTVALDVALWLPPGRGRRARGERARGRDRGARDGRRVDRRGRPPHGRRRALRAARSRRARGRPAARVPAPPARRRPARRAGADAVARGCRPAIEAALHSWVPR